jgi:hypothetical protein
MTENTRNRHPHTGRDMKNCLSKIRTKWFNASARQDATRRKRQERLTFSYEKSSQSCWITKDLVERDSNKVCGIC